MCPHMTLTTAVLKLAGPSTLAPRSLEKTDDIKCISTSLFLFYVKSVVLYISRHKCKWMHHSFLFLSFHFLLFGMILYLTGSIEDVQSLLGYRTRSVGIGDVTQNTTILFLKKMCPLRIFLMFHGCQGENFPPKLPGGGVCSWTERTGRCFCGILRC